MVGLFASIGRRASLMLTCANDVKVSAVSISIDIMRFIISRFNNLFMIRLYFSFATGFSPWKETREKMALATFHLFLWD